MRRESLNRADTGDPVRDQAVRQLRRKRGLQAHALSFVLVNGIMAGLWWYLLPTVFYWPLISLLGWGIGLAFHIWAVYSPSDLDEDRVEREMDRIQRRSPTLD